MNVGSERPLLKKKITGEERVGNGSDSQVGAIPNTQATPNKNLSQPEVRPANILLADDCAVTRRGMRSLVESQPGWHVMAEASSGRETVAKAVQLRPDLTILSVTMPGLNGVDATRLILKSIPQARVLVLTAFENQELIQRALHAGAWGYVLKSEAEANLVVAVRALLEGRTFFSSVAMDVAVEEMRRREDARHTGLTVREAEIVQLLVEGHSNKEVAGILQISSRTVENHRAHIMQKLGFGSFSELIRYTIRVGIVSA